MKFGFALNRCLHRRSRQALASVTAAAGRRCKPGSGDAQPAVEPERPTASPLGSRRASRAGARLTACRSAPC